MTSFLPFWNTAEVMVNKPENESCFPSLSFKERVIGFITCFVLGTVIQFLSFGSLFGVFAGKPEKFAISYTFGNILSLFGTSFLFGFKSQLNSMKDKTRLITSIVFILSMIMTLVSAIVFNKTLLVLLFLIIQVSSYVWYIASYIPFARDFLKGCFKKLLS